ncbi:MAG: hypothetical protein JOY90_36100 [Bradyrhizobium sp.]|uniref:hypothetical protein n=1 Tax=Bradyrhizobium sp. TaxID=376 RepID=UPI001DA07E41|nr:hypothetical protein [Bradyrhizobium sp.]MBV9565838.1 hypothetical protein [Bradyrhizobium sp.]
MAAVKPRAEVFREQKPKLTEAEMIAAAQKLRIAASFDSAPVCMSDGTISCVGIKWKLGDGTTESILIDRYCATILRGLFAYLEENNWTGTALIPPDAKPQ